jgi:hypothetical protein
MLGVYGYGRCTMVRPLAATSLALTLIVGGCVLDSIFGSDEDEPERVFQVSGLVTLDGEPLAGATVNVGLEHHSSFRAETTSDAGGGYAVIVDEWYEVYSDFWGRYFTVDCDDPIYRPVVRFSYGDLDTHTYYFQGCGSFTQDHNFVS